MAAGQERLIAVLLHVLFAGLLTGLAAVMPWTVDEPNYLHAGVELVRHFDFRAYTTILHGPLPLLANQGLSWLVPPDPIDGYLFAGRLSMLPFALLAAFFTWRLATRLFSPGVGLAALFLFVTNPIVLSHGCLMTADMALATFWVASVLAAVGWLEVPSLPRAALLGASIGLALATKYLAILLIPALGLGLLIAVLRGHVAWTWKPTETRDRQGRQAGPLRRLLALMPAATLCTTVAFCTLWLCYGLRPHGYLLKAPVSATASPQDPKAGALSSMFRSRVGDPMFTGALRLLPEPFVRGIDYQLRYAESGGPTRFAGRIGPGFVTYYPVALLTKLPLLTVVLLLAGVLWRRPRLARHRATLLATTTLTPVVYLSCFSTMQMGVRYLLMVVPLLCVVAARPVAALLTGRLGRFVVLLAAVSVLGDVLLTFPQQLGSVNRLAGPRPYLLFSDSNLAWRPKWAPDPDGDRIAARHPDAKVVQAATGPRLGLVRATVQCFAAPDKHDPTRTYHWLQHFSPIDREGEWFVFQVEEAEFKVAAARDPRAKTELAIALLHAGRAQEALELVEESSTAGEAARLTLSGETGTPRHAHLLLELGLFETLLALPSVAPVVRARAWFALSEFGPLVQELTRLEDERPLSTEEAILLASAHGELWDLDRAIAVLERNRPAADQAAAAAWNALVEQVKSQRDGMRASGR